MNAAVRQHVRRNTEMWVTETVQWRMLADIDTGTDRALTVQEERKTDWQTRTVTQSPQHDVHYQNQTALSKLHSTSTVSVWPQKILVY